MCQLTLDVDDEVLAQAEAVAETENTTVTTLLQQFVESLAARSSDRVEQVSQGLQATFAKFSRDMGDSLVESTNANQDNSQMEAIQRMNELFEQISGFQVGTRIPREELYERGSLR
ncbi:MAG: hypothetical protein NT013_13650 [Planctomycetia bacterium]|nr:hypothetical protein [Planctomycetia bacterium]